jgi:hypothetical protein
MKAGTTSLWGYLSAHPDVFMSQPKEPEFFIRSSGWDRGIEWYEELFAGAGGRAAVGEASTGYSKAHAFPGVPERIASVIPEAKLIYLLRHPIERIRSHYLNFRADRLELRPPERALRENQGYVLTSSYAYQLERYLEHFDRERILLLTSEALQSDRAATLRKVYAFLGVAPDFVPDSMDLERNRSENKQIPSLLVERSRRKLPVRALARVTPAVVRRAVVERATRRGTTSSDVRMSPQLEEELLERLRPDVAALRRYMEPGFDGWGIA